MPLLLEEGELVLEGVELGGAISGPHVEGGLNSKSHVSAGSASTRECCGCSGRVGLLFVGVRRNGDNRMSFMPSGCKQGDAQGTTVL